MAGGKETPRQKMIGMMYLVLTALLALNVSKAILDAFVAIEENIQVANENEFYRGEEKEALIQETALDETAPELMKKAKRLLQVVRKIDNMTAERIREMDQLKLRILEEGGEDITNIGAQSIIRTPYDPQNPLKPIRMHLEFVKGMDKYDEAMRVMLGNETDIKSPQGKGLEMYRNYMNYRNELVELLVASSSDKEKKYHLKMPDINAYKSEKDKLDQITRAIEKGAVMPDDKDVIRKIYAALTKQEFADVHDQKNVHWLGRTFDHAPSVAAIASLTALQKEILTARADAVATIQARIGGGEYSFNKIMALVYGPDVVNQNEEAELKVLMAAYDSEKQPVITVNGGTLQRIENGKGTVLTKGGSGEINVSGTITIRNKSGISKTLPWEKTIQVMKPHGTVSLPKMNVLYRGIENEIDASASGYPDFKISGNGVSLTKSSGGSYVGKVNTTGRKASISISGFNKQTGKTVSLGTFDFRVMNLPRPGLFFGTAADGEVVNPQERNLFVRYGPDIPLDVKFTVIDWELSTSNAPRPTKGIGNVLTQEGSNMLRQARSGSLVSFFVNIQEPGGGKRRITGTFRIR